MKTTAQLANNYRQFYFGPNWAASHFREQVMDITIEAAFIKMEGSHSIAELVYHIHYYTRSAAGVLKGGPLEGKDKFSFDVPILASQSEWEKFLDQIWKEAKEMIVLIENLPEERLWETFVEQKYGNYFRNLFGLVEHGYYHLGQIALIKKRIRQ
ncbi:MAG TPA: DUF1572 domain-containing protein [Flavobacteriales bacterium]|jgi:uncharacterized damage-inducible protein DinB|nr:DUF1572 domain-containing protein [Flavobacteriales bacterium]